MAWRHTALIAFGGWTLFALLLSAQSAALLDRRFGFWTVFSWVAAHAESWALLTVSIAALAQAFPWRPGKRLRATCVHTLAAAATTLLQPLIQLAIAEL